MFAVVTVLVAGAFAVSVAGALGVFAAVVAGVLLAGLLSVFAAGVFGASSRTRTRSKDPSATRVFVTPDYTRTNPYQRNLVDALADRGVDVEPVSIHGPLMPAKAVFRRGRPDVLHLHWLHPFLMGRRLAYSLVKGPLFLVQVFLARVFGVRIVWTVHNVVEHEARNPRLERAYRHVLARLSHSLIVHCDCAVETVRRAYRLPERYAERVAVVPHGHYADNYENEVSRADARADLGLDDEFVFLYFGRVCDYKNVPELIAAFADVEDARTRLLVAGNPRTEEVEASVLAAAAEDERIDTTLRFVPNDRVQYHMNAADAVVLPFRHELASGSAILAMSFGKPVVIPEGGCVSSFLPFDGGFTYDGDGVDALRAAMEDAMHADLDAVGAANRRAVLSQEWDHIARLTAGIYRVRTESAIPEIRGVQA